jgi:hypothetical protein
VRDSIVIDPSRFRQFGAPEEASFCLVTNSAYASAFELRTSGPYADMRVVLTDGETTFAELVGALPEPAHVLVISPDIFFESPPDDVIGPDRKLLAMACNSTPATLDIVAHFIREIERTDPDEQERFATRFFSLAESSEVLRVVNRSAGTELVFEHFADDAAYVWNQQGGSLEWGTQQIAPSGEISVLPVEIRSFDDELRLRLNGNIALHGHPILHNGTPSFSRCDQSRIHEALATMADAPLIATVEDGQIVDIDRPLPAADPAHRMLEALMSVDSRYRIIWEIGFAHNTSLTMLPGNHAMNEVYGGDNGCLHWGLGLTPYTQYHLDIISPGTQVLTDTGDLVLG